MSRTLTVQVGTRSNWVGSHYWSALEHRPEMSPQETNSLYEEDRHGDYAPRMFYVDSQEGIGRVDQYSESLTTDYHDPLSDDLPPVHRFEQELYTVHPFRSGLFKGSPVLQLPYDRWTDFWEPPEFPKHRMVVATFQTPTPDSWKYWFEYSSLTPDQLDESELRSLIEGTDGTVAQLTMLGDFSSSMTERYLGISEYLGECYPKANALGMGFGVEGKSIHSLMNLAHALTRESKEWENRGCVLAIFPEPDLPMIQSSGQSAIWMDCMHGRVGKEGNGLRVESPFMSIGKELIYGVTGEKRAEGSAEGSTGSGAGSFPISQRSTPFVKNLANPISINQDVRAGTLDSRSLVPLFKLVQGALRRFERDFVAVYEQFSDRIEREYFQELNECMANLIGPSDEDDE